ncbi:MAG: substrate-binding domain-containing protein [Bryobacteraceae bacterium]|nr:substrate-binding domain-containing protein [Bryobacteraceae bacterium]
MDKRHATRLRELREARGVSAAALARLAEVERQTIYAIEAGTYAPNTLVALRIARALGSTVEEIFGGEPEVRRLRVAGCDPALPLLVAAFAARGCAAVLIPATSAQALDWLSRGAVEIAGTHLGRAPKVKGAVAIALAEWEEGLVTRVGNPKSLAQAADLARPDVAIVNRPPGAGSRELLDRRLAKAGVETERVGGYERIAPTHFEAAIEVALGTADCCIAPRIAAAMFGLEFVPWREERFDLIVSAEHAAVAGDILNELPFRRKLAELPGYETRRTGSAESR